LRIEEQLESDEERIDWLVAWLGIMDWTLCAYNSVIQLRKNIGWIELRYLQTHERIVMQNCNLSGFCTNSYSEPHTMCVMCHESRVVYVGRGNSTMIC